MLSAIALVRKDIFSKKPAGLAPKLAAPVASGVADIGLDDPASAHHIRPHVAPQARTIPTAIHVLSGIAEGDIITLDQFETLIGRLDTSNIALPDNFVSSKHARIFWQGDTCYIEDLHSTNGTVVDGKQIERITELLVGSKITIGKNVLELI